MGTAEFEGGSGLVKIPGGGIEPDALDVIETEQTEAEMVGEHCEYRGEITRSSDLEATHLAHEPSLPNRSA